MSNISNFNDLLEIYSKLDSLDNFEEKLAIVSSWLSELSGISRATICNLVEKVEKINHEFLLDQESSTMQLKPQTAFLVKMMKGQSGTIEIQDDQLNRLLEESAWNGPIRYYTITSRKGKILGAILLKTNDFFIRENMYDLELKFLCLKIRQLFEIDYLNDKLEKENDFLSLIINRENGDLSKIITSRSSSLINWFNLPLYIMDLKGRFLYANHVFLNLLKFDNLDQLNKHTGLFPQPMQREKEWEQLYKNNRVDNFRLTVTCKDGVSLDVRDSALLMGSYIFGFFYNVTELVRLNRELKEALDMQELLNDKLISSSLLLQRTQTTTIRSLARLAEYRDGETGEHLDRICSYSAILTQEVYKRQPYNWRISEKYIYDLIVSSMLHDIGKVGVPDSILLKPGKLTLKEFDRMKNHTIWGWAILNQADMELGEQSYLTLAASIALHHHERYNGTGYPYKLEGEKIPLSARIEAIADVYDALTSKRPYKDAWGHDQAVEVITRERGAHFDPVLVDIFLNIEDKFFRIRNKAGR